MKRIVSRNVLQRAALGAFLSGYLSSVGYGIVSARAADDPMDAEWGPAALLTLPGSLVGGMVDPPPKDERAWFTAVTAGGAVLNVLLFWLFLWWLTRRHRPVDSQVVDYADHGYTRLVMQ
jgi:hypothetical protein